MNVDEFMKLERYTRAQFARALTEQIKADNRENPPIYEGRLYKLMAGGSARDYELRALLALTGNQVDDFRGHK